MSDVKIRIITKLDELISEAKKLHGEIVDPNDTRVDMWEMRSRKLLEKIGGEKLKGEFNAAGAFSFNMRMSDHERLNYSRRQLEGRKNYLLVVKEEMEFFQEEDESELKKIKHKFVGGINLGIFKAEYVQGRE